MCSENPKSRRKFNSEIDELDYLLEKVMYWYFIKNKKYLAKRFSTKMEKLLKKYFVKPETILGEESWAILYELNNNWHKVSEHRENELNLRKKLHRSFNKLDSINKKEMIDYTGDYEEMSLCMEFLAQSYYNDNKIEKAYARLKNNKIYCKRHNIEFTNQELLHLINNKMKNLLPDLISELT